MMAIAVAAMSFTACSNDLTEDVTPSQEFTVQINAVENLSRTHFGNLNEGKYPTLWDATDKVRASLNMTSAKNSTETTIADDGTTASFKLSLNESTAPYTIYAISPASVASSISSEHRNWTITIPDSQEPSATSCDPAAQVVVSQTEALETLPSSVDMKFEHLTAYAKINFTNVTLGDAVVNSITITADQYIAGKHYYQVADNGSYTAGQLRSANGAVKSITITTSELNNVWVALAPVAVSELTFTINTDKGAITKEVTGLNKEFKSGVVATFNVDMTGKTIEKADEYTLVTALSVLAEGDNVIIAAADENYAISTDNSGYYRPATAITKDGNTIIPTTTVGIFTVHDAGTNLYAFKDASNDDAYLYDSSTGDYNNLATQATNDANGYWDITIKDATTGAAKVVSQGTNKVMQYNYNSGKTPRFACYAGSQKDVALYYKSNGGAKIAIDPQIIASDINNVAAAGVTNATANLVVRGLTGTITATPDGTVVSAASVNGNVLTYTVAANTGAAREGSITLQCGSYKKVITVSQVAKPAGDVTVVTYDFKNISNFSTAWSGYDKRSVTYAEAVVTFESACKQSGTITDMPVTKGQPVSLVMSNGKSINSVEFLFKQWGTKAQTITLHYSTDGGSTYTSTGTTSSNFTISKSDLPEGTNAVKVTFSSSSNQIGIESATITYKN